jgi:hypothetical protein
MELQTIAVVISAGVFGVSVVSQIVFFAYAWGRVNETIEGIKQEAKDESARTMTAIRDVSHGLSEVAKVTHEHGKDIQALKTWRDIVSPTFKANGRPAQ